MNDAQFIYLYACLYNELENNNILITINRKSNFIHMYYTNIHLLPISFLLHLTIIIYNKLYWQLKHMQRK